MLYFCCPCRHQSGIYLLRDNSSIERQKGLTTSHLHVKVDPFASQLLEYRDCTCISLLVCAVYLVYVLKDRRKFFGTGIKLSLLKIQISVQYSSDFNLPSVVGPKCSCNCRSNLISVHQVPIIAERQNAMWIQSLPNDFSI